MAMGDNDKGLSAAYIRRAVEASLRRLQTDVIDLYQSHTDDAETPLEETLARLRRADQGRQGARDRRLELHRAAPGRRARPASAAQRPAALRDRCSRSTTWSSALPTRPSSSRSASSSGLGVINYYALAQRLPHRQVPQRAPTSSKSVRSGGASKLPRTSAAWRVLAALDAVAADHRRDARRRWRWPGRSPGRASPRRSPARPSPAQLDELVARARLQLDTPSIELIDRASRVEPA